MSNLVKQNNTGVTRTGGLTSLLKGTSAITVAPIAQTDIAYYNQRLKNGHVGFLVDATGSRSSTWKEAQKIQADMFKKVGQQESLEIRLVHFKGSQNPQDTGWQTSSNLISQRMSSVECEMGPTQILSSLDLYLNTPRTPKIIVLIGDCFEENQSEISQKIDALKDKGIRVFAFHEDTPNYDSKTGERVFQQLAFGTNGAFAKFGGNMKLDDLCHAATEYALNGADGLKRLAATGNKGALAVGQSMKLLPPSTR